MLKYKLFRAFAILVALFGGLSVVVGVRTINARVIAEAQTRVRLNLSSAWAVFNTTAEQIGTIMRLVAAKEKVVVACEEQKWDDPELLARLDRIRINFGLDFLDLISPEGRVVLRTRPPHRTGDYRLADPAVATALKGSGRTCMVVMSSRELDAEGEELAQRAFFELEPTPHARKDRKQVETRGMVIASAEPVQKGMQIVGVVYGGVLVNRNLALVDRIQEVVYRNERYRERPLGTATIFLGDTRIATTVRLENGNRAMGTRCSKEVADRVLDNGLAWVGEAFVVNDWYLTAYEPIRDGLDRIVGMLYVGILKRPYQDIAREIVVRYVVISLVALVAGLVLAFFLAARLAGPIHSLVEASNRMRAGESPKPVPVTGSCQETDQLISAFNEMTAALVQREEKLRAVNRNYMETLGFVSHELKGPVATIMNYEYLLRTGKLGPLTEKQQKALKSVNSASRRLVEMVRHYLNLARIENRELQPIPARVRVLEDIVEPLLEDVAVDLTERHMQVVNEIAADVTVQADPNMTREVFENLVNNAIKYGREGGTITLRARQSGAFIEFAVRNDGEGIPPEKQGELFGKFVRLHEQASSSRQRGTGLGLFITRNIVEAHGGKIVVESLPGQWAEFRFTLPSSEKEDAGKEQRQNA